MPLMPDQLADFVELTLNKFEKNKWTDFTLDLRYKVARELFDKSGLNWDSGPEYEFKVRTTADLNARVTGLFDTDRSNINNAFTNGRVPWSMYTTNFTYDENEESFQSDNAQKIVDVIRARDHGMYEDLWELFEEHLWSAPPSSTQSPRQLYGLPGWIVKNGAVAAGARNGGNPTGFATGIGGLDSATHDMWKNWTFQHDGTVTLDGFIKRIVKAMKFCRFEAAHAYPALNPPNKGHNYGLYTTYPIWESLAVFCRAQNDNLGKDGAAMFDGSPTIMGNRVEEVPYLTENDSGTSAGNDPIYGVNWNSIKFARRRGKWLNRSKPLPVAGSHTVRAVHLDSHIASVCNDRRANFVGHRGTVA